MKNKKLYFDMLLNILAAGVPLVVLQMVIYPFAARILDADTYGLMIAFYALLLLVNDSFGKAANNIRLINNKEHKNQEGDYNIVIFIYVLAGIAVTTGGIVFYRSINGPLDLILQIITGIMMVYNAYLIVYFRIRLNYYAILLNAVFMSVGFIIGFFLFRITDMWSLVFFFGHLGCFAYLSITTGLLKEPFKKTKRFNRLLSDTTVLALATFLSQGMGQVDKLVLLPLLGGATVSVYYTAALAGKVMSLATGPVNSVILTYIAGRDSLSRKTFQKYLLLCTAVCAGMAVMILILSRPVLGLLFPQFVGEAMKLVPYTTANVFLFVMAGMITPLVMRYCNIWWQIIINGSGFCLYITLSILLLYLFGVKGFCVGIGISHLLRVFMMLFIYNKRAYVTE